jgi:beta-lactam-binding protein with PASTA domain
MALAAALMKEARPAKAQLQAVGLEYDGNGQAVQANSGSVLNTVTAQEPAAGTRVPPQTRVRLTYSYVPDERFTWVRPYVNYRDVVRLQRAGGG